MSGRTAARTRLLREPDFRRWYLSSSISYAGTAASAVALPLLAYRATGSATVTAAVVALEALPYLMFGLLAGAVADRWPRKRMMVCADVLAAALVASVPAADRAGALTGVHVLVVAFGVGTAFCWFDAAAWGALTRVVGRDRLPAANSWIWGTSTVLGIAVPAAVGLALTVTGPSTVLAVDAATYLASAALLWRLRTGLDAPRGAADDGAAPRSVRTDIVAGLSYLWHQPTIRAMSLAGFCLSLAGGGVLGLLVVHADRQLGVGSEDGRLGTLYTAAAVGALVAALLLPVLRRRVGVGPLSIVTFLAYAGGVCALAAVGWYPAALLLWAAWSFASTLAITNAITVRQQLTPDDLQGRVNTTARMIAWGGTPFGAALGGVTADAFGITAAYLALAAPVLAGVVILLRSPVRSLHSIDHPSHPHRRMRCRHRRLRDAGRKI